jgi:hypothetical protein
VKPGVFLSGGSGGVYALIMSHLGTVIMNHRYNDAFLNIVFARSPSIIFYLYVFTERCPILGFEWRW